MLGEEKVNLFSSIGIANIFPYKTMIVCFPSGMFSMYQLMTLEEFIWVWKFPE